MLGAPYLDIENDVFDNKAYLYYSNKHSDGGPWSILAIHPLELHHSLLLQTHLGAPATNVDWSDKWTQHISLGAVA
jgi:hypothetical protein